MEKYTPVDDTYDKLGEKVTGTYKKIGSNEQGIQWYDKVGNRQDGEYKKCDFVPKQD